MRGFELLALDHVRILRIVGEQSQIECGDKLARGAIPELKDRRRQASSRHLVYKAGFAKHFQRCRVRCGGARIVLQLIVDVEQADRQPVAPEQQRAKKSDGSAA